MKKFCSLVFIFFFCSLPLRCEQFEAQSENKDLFYGHVNNDVFTSDIVNQDENNAEVLDVDEESVVDVINEQEPQGISVDDENLKTKNVNYSKKNLQSLNLKPKVKTKQEELKISAERSKSFGYKTLYDETELYATYKKDRFSLRSGVLQGSSTSSQDYYNYLNINPSLKLSDSLFLRTGLSKEIGFDSAKSSIGLELIPFKNHQNIHFSVDAYNYFEKGTNSRQKLNLSTQIKF